MNHDAFNPTSPNESVGKVLLVSENKMFGGHLTLPKHEIVECGAFCEVFFHISPKNLLGGFFYRLNVRANRRAKVERSAAFARPC